MTTQPNLDATTRTWKRRDLPMVFLLRYNQRKLKSANPATRQAYQQWQECWCVLFPVGSVILERSYVNFFHSMSEFKEHCEMVGDYTIEWVHEMGQETA